VSRVAIISIRGTSNAGGVERVVARHQALLEGRHEVRVVALPQEGRVARLLARRPLLGRAALVTFPLLSWIPARWWAGRGGRVLSHGYSAIGLSCDAVFAHGCWAAYRRAAGLREGRFGRLIERYERMAARLGRRVICVSESVAAQWTEHYGVAPEKMRVVHNGVDTAVFTPTGGAELVCQGPSLRVLFVGRFEDAKGMAVLERLHRELAEDAAGPALSVCLCSPTTPPPEMAARFPRFELRSRLDARQLAEEYRRADLFLLPSRYEAFELSTIEALACGTPVLIHDTGSRPTLHRLGCPAVHDLIPGGSPLAALREAAARFRGLRRAEVGAWTAARFGAATMSRELAAAFRELGLA
jgi:glycosyltransferase involved in cell wall biosynthesis